MIQRETADLRRGSVWPNWDSPTGTWGRGQGKYPRLPSTILMAGVCA